MPPTPSDRTATTRRNTLARVLAALLLFVASACSTSTDATDAPEQIASRTTGAGEHLEAVADSSDAAPVPAGGATTAEQPTAETSTENPPFEPPYPERQDPFSRPATDATRNDAGVPGQAESLGEVRLKGFVHVDRPKAVFTVGDRVLMMAEGDEQLDVTVVKIAPPKVTFQRGRHRWEANFDASR